MGCELCRCREGVAGSCYYKGDAARSGAAGDRAPPSRRESRTSTCPPAVAAAAACSGVRNREIDDTNRASPARSTLSARPKLWITFATGLPLTGCRSALARPPRCRSGARRPPVAVRRRSRAVPTADPMSTPSRFVRRVSRKNTPTTQPHHRSSCPATRHKSCAYKIGQFGKVVEAVTRTNATDHSRICLRTAEVRAGGRTATRCWAARPEVDRLKAPASGGRRRKRASSTRCPGPRSTHTPLVFRSSG